MEEIDPQDYTGHWTQELIGLDFPVARNRANAWYEMTLEHCVVYHSPSGPGFDWATESHYKHYLPEVWPEDIVYHTGEGYYDD
jgi:hypothetical protein